MVATQWDVPIPGPKRVTRRERGTGVLVTSRLQSTLIWYQVTRVPNRSNERRRLRASN